MADAAAGYIARRLTELRSRRAHCSGLGIDTKSLDDEIAHLEAHDLYAKDAKARYSAAPRRPVIFRLWSALALFSAAAAGVNTSAFYLTHRWWNLLLAVLCTACIGVNVWLGRKTRAWGV